MTAPSALASGALFANDFEIVRPLRTGGMGTVYIALQKSTGKRRALKLMLLALVSNQDLRRRFEQEARIASLIKSDHVVEVVGAGVDEATGVPWLAMELLEGADLDETITVRGALGVLQTRTVLRELCHAVGAAHAAGIIHRDLKPENIFLASSKHVERGRTVKVLDFGIAKIAEEATAKLTGAMGSPMWMAPEQTGRGSITPAADVWAIGLIAFYLLTGRVFWLSAGETERGVAQIMREVVLDEIPTARMRARELGVPSPLPAWFDVWFARCVTRDPAARVPNATEAFALFERLCDAPASVRDLEQLNLPIPVVVRSLTPSSDPHARTEIDVTPASPAGFDTDAASRGSRPGLSARSSATQTAPARLAFLLAAAAVLATALTAYFAFGRRPAPPPPLPNVPAPIAIPGIPLPPELARTGGAQWFARVHSRCNPVEVSVLFQSDPPSKAKDGAGFGAACFALAGHVERARPLVDALPAGDRAWAAWAVFEIVHPIADSGDDTSAGPAMRFVLDYWPNNYMALYHAGMSEYREGDPKAARAHLGRFLEIYTKADGFTVSAKQVLAAIDEAPRGAKDCTNPITIDPEGHKVFRAGCAPN